MKSSYRIIGMASVLAVTLFVCSVLLGCDFRQAPSRGVKNVSWSRSGQERPAVPGIDQAEVSLFTWNDGAAFVIWSDVAGRTRGTMPRQPGDPRGSARYFGTVGNQPFECLTLDGKTGTVTLGEQSYELADGRLILVSTQSDALVVKQLEPIKLNVKPDGSMPWEQVTLEHLEKIAETDADIRAFFLDSMAAVDAPAQ